MSTLQEITQYQYYTDAMNGNGYDEESIAGALELSDERYEPKLMNPDYLVLKRRRELFTEWIGNLTPTQLDVLDIGGRIQPYRPLLKNKIRTYRSIDPQFEGLIDTVAVGEQLPFKDETFDLIICTQVLGYAKDPFRFVAEIHRVLKKDAVILLSAPSLFPRHHDEHWRFMPDGLGILFSRFSQVEISPEGYTISNIFRTVNVCLDIFITSPFLSRLQRRLVFPVLNLAGLTLDRLSRGNDQFTTNHSVCAVK